MRFEQLRRRHEHDEAGFSMIEIIVATAVFSVVMTLIIGMIINLMNTSDQFQERTQEQADTRLAVDQLVRDLRQAYTGTSLTRIEVMGSKTIRFYSPDRDADFHLRRIEYALATSALTRSVTVSTNTASAVVGKGVEWTFGATGAAVPVLKGITNTTLFTYWTPVAVATAVQQVRAVQIDFVVDQSPNSPPGPQPYHTQVDLRVTNAT